MRPVPVTAIRRPFIFFAVGFALCGIGLIFALKGGNSPTRTTVAYLLAGLGMLIAIGSTVAGFAIMFRKSLGRDDVPPESRTGQK